MNTAVMSQGASLSTSSSDANQRWPFGRKILFVLLLVGTLWGVIATSQLTTAMNEAEELRVANIRLVGTNSDLAADAKALPVLRAELARTQTAFTAELKRKRELATLYERAEAARKQAVADHGAALNRISALEKAASSKAGTVKQPQPKRK